MIRSLTLGSLSLPLSLFLLLASAGALVFAGFHVHRVLQPVFRNTFIAPPVPRRTDAPSPSAFEAMDVESPSFNHWADPDAQPVQQTRAAAAAQADEDSTEDLWRFLEERIELFSPAPARPPEGAEPAAQREAD